MSVPIETTDLTKSYRDKIAVNQLNLRVEQGEIFGFLGPNGAGKTTTILMLLGLTEPSGGQASVCGFNPIRQPLEVKRRVGYLPENPGFYEDLTAEENLLYIARLNRFSEEVTRRKITEVLEHVELADDRGRLVQEYSRGMKQRLGIAEVLLKETQVVVLDEPTLGIDPDGVTRILDLITSLSRERGLTVLLCSHQLHQVQRICQRMGIIVKGRMIVQGNLDQLGSEILREHQWNFFLEVGGDTERLEDELRSIPGVSEVAKRGKGWFLRCVEDIRPQVVPMIAGRGLALLQLRSENPTLEDIYLKYFREA